MKAKIVPVVITLCIFAMLLDACVFVFTFLLLPAEDNPEYAGFVITLESSAFCPGGCNANYHLKILGNGTGIYTTSTYSAPDAHTFKVTQTQLAQLILAFESADYFSLKSGYAGDTDSQRITTSISFQGRTKTVSHIAGSCATAPSTFNQDPAPPGLCTLEYKIIEIVNPDQWWTPQPP